MLSLRMCLLSARGVVLSLHDAWDDVRESTMLGLNDAYYVLGCSAKLVHDACYVPGRGTKLE